MDTLNQRISHYFPHAQREFRFINAAALWKQVQARPPKVQRLTWASQPMTIQEGEIGLVKLTDYYAFVKDPDGKIAERLFDSNVRGYWPNSPINKRIADTLKNTQDKADFWLLNNGITILTEKTATTAAFLEIELHDPQIVNGLQTSRQIYNHFSAAALQEDSRRVLVRIIRTTDTTTRDEVIRCTNSQNEMPEEALRATNPIHRQLEVAFHREGLYYDRRKGHYRDQGKPVDKIVSVIEVLQAMMSVVLLRPDEARGRPRDYIKKNTEYNSVFGTDQNGADRYTLTLYMKATQICRRVAEFLDNKTMESIHRRNINFYLCMYTSCVSIGSAYAIPNKIQQIDLEAISEQVMESYFKRVTAMYEKLAGQYKTKDGEKDYDSIAKGPLLLKVVLADLKRRFNKKP